MSANLPVNVQAAILFNDDTILAWPRELAVSLLADVAEVYAEGAWATYDDAARELARRIAPATLRSYAEHLTLVYAEPKRSAR